MMINFKLKELELIDYVLGNGYGDGDIFEEGLIDDPVDQELFRAAWGKIIKARRKSEKTKIRVGANVPKSLVALCKKDGRVIEIRNEGPTSDSDSDYWLVLADGWNWAECGSVHERTVADCRAALRCVQKDKVD